MRIVAAPRRTLWKTLAAPVAVAACALAFAGPAAGSSGRVMQYNSLEPAVVAKINETRAARGLARVRVAPRLLRAATRHANSMGTGGYFSHDLRTSSGLKPFSSWIRSYWPGPGYRSWSAGENLYWATYAPSAREVVRAWMGSPPHRANLLRPGFRRVGLGIARGTFLGHGGATVVTADFAGG